ncbi:hypothetical protein FF38_02988 [Lucilia cuprina]|uniref:Uncharacterized protein n=1 Tax=Lucilia cuprina TaxID=7375 RepID=A0A0L0CQ97_LUCCU|nr:hypothetical protein FF38_02988 [Lucilia cuprina]
MPYVPLWSNIMGHFVDDTHSRISNSPVEGYFSLVKNILLKGQRNVRTSEYVRISKEYVHAKINELQTTYKLPQNTEVKRKATKPSILAEEKWKRTPRKNKEKLNKTILHGEKLFKKTDVSLPIFNSDRFPRKIKDVKIIVGDYRPIFDNLYETPKPFQTTTVYLNEFESLNPRKNLFNNVVEIYMHIILYELKITEIEICTCEQDPLGEKENTKQEIYSTILKAISEIEFSSGEWEKQELDHPIQSDIFNCGVLCCQFLEALLKKRNLNEIINPNEYRNIMKNKLRAMSKDRSDECLHCEGVPNASFNPIQAYPR